MTCDRFCPHAKSEKLYNNEVVATCYFLIFRAIPKLRENTVAVKILNVYHIPT